MHAPPQMCRSEIQVSQLSFICVLSSYKDGSCCADASGAACYRYLWASLLLTFFICAVHIL